MKKLLLIGTAVLLMATSASALTVILPPEEFDHPFAGEVIVTRLPELYGDVRT